MAKVSVVCPTCATKLDLDAEHLGTEVQCGSCHEVFTAKKPERTSSRKDDDDRPSRRRERDDDDEDYAPRRRRRRSGTSSDGGGEAPVMAIFGLILGIVSTIGIVCCWPLGIPIGLLGLLLSFLGRKGSPGLGIAGILANSLGIIGGVGMFVFALFIPGQNGQPNLWNQIANPQPANQWPPPRNNNFR
jgi:hypothetical protein